MTVATPEIEPGIADFFSDQPAEGLATALGTPDQFCHLLEGSGPRTLCELVLVGPYSPHVAKRFPWCPNGNPSCPECEARREE